MLLHDSPYKIGNKKESFGSGGGSLDIAPLNFGNKKAPEGA